MAKKKQLSTLDTRTEEIIREEALRIARATLTPGQTAEETKLIARGIAKGIATYKDQERIKQRERAKRLNKGRAVETAGISQNIKAETIGASGPCFDRRPVLTAAGLFLLAGFLHLVRFLFGTQVTIGKFSLPPYWSAVTGLAAIGLAFWIYRATQAAFRRIR